MKKIIIASGPVIVEEGKVLLDKHGDTEFWKFCGGRPEESETLQETAARRAKEELGVEIEILDETPYFMHTLKDVPEGKSDVILVHYLAKRIGEIEPGADIREWRWIPLEDLKKENLAPNVLPTLEHFNILTS